MTVILAIDPATKTGCAIGAPGDEKPFIYTINFRSDQLNDRIDIAVKARNWIDRTLDGKQVYGRPDVLAIEPPVMSLGFKGKTNVSSTYLAHGLHFTFCAAARQRGIRIIETPINAWRKYCFGSGKLKRAEAKLKAFEVCKYLNWEVEDDNGAEAACIFLFACSQIEPTRAMRIEPLFLRRSA